MNKIPVSISARHIHLSEKDRIALFGETPLEKLRDLSQSGQFATTATVTISTDAGEIPNVRILGPDRPETQVEISKTDSFTLKLQPPVRLSGDLTNTSGIKITAENGNSIAILYGVIIAARHLHCDPISAQKLNFTDGQKISARFHTSRGGILEDIIVRVSPEATLDLHLDTDEANALDATSNTLAEIIN
ncbi:phosphate propanoyltransferase [Candidatus Saccharibacteria bacterium]|nr:phosphate propanoyltransferase [Candidatus Saccharibacteria bacterium]